MLRWSVVALGLALSSCALGAGIDPPSADVGSSDGGLSGGVDDGNEGAIPPSTDGPGAGTGGLGCCLGPNLGGSSGAMGGEGP